MIDPLVQRLNIAGDQNHLTIGLFGHWGSGKSNFIYLLHQALDKKDKINESLDSGTPNKTSMASEFLYGEFNACKYEHTDNFQAGIAQEVISALISMKK
ncbi:MAG: hypothetical protein HRT37_08820 [Alteromonadaceae bacterium]|nr:hypothetical protein [Alteromonadaceae bacterium]